MKKENLGRLKIRVIPKDVLECIKSIPYCPTGDISFNPGTTEFGYSVRLKVNDIEHLLKPNFIDSRVNIGDDVYAHFVCEQPKEIIDSLISQSRYYQEDIYQPES